MVVPEYNANAVERGRTRVDRVDKIITALHSISGVEFSLLEGKHGDLGEHGIDEVFRRRVESIDVDGHAGEHPR